MRAVVHKQILAAVLTAWLTTALAAENSKDQPLKIEKVLSHLQQVAELYRDEALHFTCKEKIVYTTKRNRIIQNFDYIYVYDEQDGLLDYRFDPKDRKALIVHGGLERPYSWIFVFEAAKRDLYAYQLLGEDRALGRNAVKVRFEPVPPFTVGINDFEGVAWVDLETWQLLRVEAERVPEARELLNQEFTERFKTEFGVVENGMRFPSSVGIRRANFKQRGRPGTPDYQANPIYRVSQKYTEYRFFDVGSKTKVMGHVPTAESDEEDDK